MNPRRDRIINVVFALMLLVGVGLMSWRVYENSRPAATPAIFADRATWDDAKRRAAESGKPLLVVVSATWCGPCQSYKRGALSDPKLEAWVRDNAVAVMLDADTDRDAATSLDVRSLPTTILLRGDEQLFREVGVVPADMLVGQLSAASK